MTELTIVNKCTSHQEICKTSNTRSISYIKPIIEEVDWQRAWNECNTRNLTLPVICNKDEQDALVDSLKRIRSSSVWTSGKKINFANWTWIDGQPYMGRG